MYVVRTRTSTYTFFGAFVYIHNWHIAAFAGNTSDLVTILDLLTDTF